MEINLKELDGIKRMTGLAADNYGALILEFEFDWVWYFHFNSNVPK